MKDQPSFVARLIKNNKYVFLIIFILGIIIYGQILSFSYTYLDDNTLILSYYNRLQDISYIKSAFFEDVFHNQGKGFYYRPMVTVSFMIDAMIGGDEPVIYHLSNLLFHILATWLVFLFFLELKIKRLTSFYFALIFLIHPLACQTVAWIPGRNDSLLAIFFLSAFIFFIKFLYQKRTVFLLLHLLFFILALFTKETAVVLIILGLYYLLFFAKNRKKYTLLFLLTWVLITTGWLVLRYHALHGSHGYSISEMLMAIIYNSPAILAYLGKSIFPFEMSVFPILRDMRISLILGIPVLLFIVYQLFKSKKQELVYLFFALLWIILLIVPSLIQDPTKVPNFSEHRFYVSLIGLLLFISKQDNLTRYIISDKTIRVVGLLIIVIFSVLTIRHCRNYKDKIAFWSNAVETSPSYAFNHNNLGAIYFLDGDYQNAEKYFRQAVDINPSEPLANGNIGLICMNSGRLEEAEQFYFREIKINPNYDNVYFNLGILYSQTNRVNTAIELWIKTIEINPYYADAYNNLYQYYKYTNDVSKLNELIRKAEQNKVQILIR